METTPASSDGDPSGTYAYPQDGAMKSYVSKATVVPERHAPSTVYPPMDAAAVNGPFTLGAARTAVLKSPRARSQLTVVGRSVASTPTKSAIPNAERARWAT